MGASPSDVAPTRVPAGVMELDRIRLGPCEDLLRLLPDQSVDVVVSSPPYNLGKEYEARSALDEYLESQRVVLAECARALKSTGSVFWQVGAYADRGSLIPLDIRFFPILEGLGLIPRNRIVWIRQHGLHASRKFSCRHETILWFTKSENYKFRLDEIRVPQKYADKKHHRGPKRGELSCDPRGKNPGDVWLFRNVKHNHEEQTIHPCQFPEDLVARIVLATTDPSDVVLDPYMGAGTVAVVSRDHQRHFVGAEIEPKYHSVALRRLSGEPDADGGFPNLKNLRSYTERTGIPPSRYRFDVQVGRSPTPRSHAKIYSEEHHYEALVSRLDLEESAFARRVRGDAPPQAAEASPARQAPSRRARRSGRAVGEGQPTLPFPTPR